jgi:hypothetical protein
MMSSLTCVSISPSQFVPRHCSLSNLRGSVSLKPIPHIVSVGLASTKSVPAVDSKYAFNSSCSLYPWGMLSHCIENPAQID